MEIFISNYKIYLVSFFRLQCSKAYFILLLTKYYKLHLLLNVLFRTMFCSPTPPGQSVFSSSSKLLFSGPHSHPTPSECPGSVAKQELISQVLFPEVTDLYMLTYSLCVILTLAHVQEEIIYDLMYSKQSALNQEIAYLVRFSRPSKIQEPRTLKCSSQCEFRLIGRFLTSHLISLYPCNLPIKFYIN